MSINISGCSKCGSSTNTLSRLAACGAQSSWQTKLNRSEFKTQDDLKIWPLELCDSCLAVSYKAHLQSGMVTSGIMLIIGLILYLIIPSTPAGTLHFIDVDVAVAQERTPFLVDILSLVFKIGKYLMLLIAIGSGLFFATTAFRYLIKRNVMSGTLLSSSQQKNAFSTEGGRIISELRRMGEKIGEDIQNKFPLPKFKEFDELSLTEDVKGKLDSKRYSAIRLIVGIGNSHDDLAKAISPAWRNLLTDLRND